MGQNRQHIQLINTTEQHAIRGKKYTERLILTAVKDTKTEDEIRKAKKCMKQKIARYFGL